MKVVINKLQVVVASTITFSTQTTVQVNHFTKVHEETGLGAAQ